MSEEIKKPQILDTKAAEEAEEAEEDFNSITLDDATEDDQFYFAYDLGERKHYPQAIDLFQQLYNPSSKRTLRKGLCMVAEYYEEQDRNGEAIDWYYHALTIQQATNPEEDLRYYVPDYIETKINFLKNKASPYKIAVYAICGNEIDNLKDGFASMGEADYICVLDTGSTDGSYELLQEYQKNNPEKVFISQKTYNPGRFDTPRNDSLKLVPKEADICICTDPDERLVSGGSKEVKCAWHPECERIYYLYAWSHLQNGAPARVFGYDKIHKNSGEGYGKFPVHEALYHNKYHHADLQPSQYIFLKSDYIMLHHYPRYKETRVNYLPLLEMRFQEYPDDFYSNIYLTHEYTYQEKYEQGIDFTLNHALPYCQKNNVEKIYFSNLYMFLGDCYFHLEKYEDAIQNYQIGIQQDASYRDSYLHLAKVFLKTGRYPEAIDIINQGFIKSRRYTSGLEEDTSGFFEPGRLLTYAYANIGAIDVAKQCAQFALTLDPENQELKANGEKLNNYGKN